MADESASSNSWRRNLYVLWVGETLTILGFASCYPFLPFYLADLGVQSFERRALWAGAMAASSAGVEALAAPFWGMACLGWLVHPCEYPGKCSDRALSPLPEGRARRQRLVAFTLPEEPPMLARFLRRVLDTGRTSLASLRRRVLAATKPATAAPLAGALADLPRSKPELLAENALLRQQLLILRRSIKRPRCRPADRAILVLLASRARAWRQALLIVQPETLLRWHRQLFSVYWRWKSQAAPRARRAKVSDETIALIREMATANRLWGAERIRGELLKLDIRVAKWTVQKYMRDARPPQRAGQRWAAFVRNHAHEIWACDFLPVTDVLFRPVYAFFIVALGSRRVVHVGVTRHATDAWVAQQLREATPYGQQPRFLIRDNDRKYGPAFARVAAATGIAVLRTAYRAPRQNATCERFLGSVRRECLDHVPVLGEAHLRRVLGEYVAYFNRARPHQGLQQRVPDPVALCALPPEAGGRVRVVPVLGGLHHTYLRAA